MAAAPHGVEAGKFACRITKVTGEGEQVDVTFAAATQQELDTRLKEAAEVLQRRMRKNNDRVLELRKEVAEAQAEGLKRRGAGNGGAAAGPAHP